MPIGDVHADQSRAVAIGRPGIEVTRATEGAVAVLDPVALKTPFGQWHVDLSLSKQVHLTHWGALDRQSGHLPFRKAILEPTRQVAPASQKRDRLEREDAPGPPAISDDLAIRRQLRQPELQPSQRDIECAGEVAVGELVLGTHVDEGYRSATQTVEQLLSRHRLHIVARPKTGRKNPTMGGGDGNQRCAETEIAEASADQPAAALPTEANNPRQRPRNPRRLTLRRSPRQASTEPAVALSKPAPNEWPYGTHVMVRKRKSWREATIISHLDPDHWRAGYPGGGSGMFREADIRAYDPKRDAMPAKQPRRATATAPRKSSRSRYAIDPQAITAGRLPQRAPVVTSAANPHYQKHFDRLFDLAKAGDWDGVRNYEVKGSNSYSKMVARYRQDLLAVHAASEAAP